MNITAWTIFNLQTYNKDIDTNTLIKLSLFHFLDILTFNQKLIILNNIFYKDKHSTFETYILEYFNDYMLQEIVLYYLIKIVLYLL